jgi:hypothetical protein
VLLVSAFQLGYPMPLLVLVIPGYLSFHEIALLLAGVWFGSLSGDRAPSQVENRFHAVRIDGLHEVLIESSLECALAM